MPTGLSTVMLLGNIMDCVTMVTLPEPSMDAFWILAGISNRKSPMSVQNIVLQRKGGEGGGRGGGEGERVGGREGGRKEEIAHNHDTLVRSCDLVNLLCGLQHV